MSRSWTIRGGITRTIAIGTCVVVCSCAQTTRLYQPPASGAGARVRFLTDGTVHLVPAKPCLEFDAPRAGLGPVADGGGIFSEAMNGRTLGMPGAAEAAKSGFTSTELLAEVDEPLLISYVHTTSVRVYPRTTYWTCRAFFRFAPKAGIDYAAVAQSVEAGRRCGIAVFEIAADGKEHERYVAVANDYKAELCDEVR